MLSKIPNVIVIGHTSAKLVSTGIGYADAAAKLGADYLVECNVRKTTETIRVTAWLIDSGSGTQLWSQSFDQSLNVQDILSLQSEIAVKIAGALGVELSTEAALALNHLSTTNREVYDLYVQGRFLWGKRTADELLRAKDLFEQAIAIDNRFVEAYSGLADCYSVLPDYAGWDALSTIPAALSTAKAALAIDTLSAEAHTSFAFAKDMWFDWDEAEIHYRRAIELNPQYAWAKSWLSYMLIPLGRHDEAIAMAQAALLADPLSMINNDQLGYAYYLAGRYEEAIEQHEHTFRLFPEWTTRLPEAYAETGQFDRSVDAYIRRLDVTESDTAYVRSLKTVYAESGWEAFIEAQIDRELLVKGPFPENHVGSQVARWYAMLGHGDKVIEWVEHAYEVHDPNLRNINVLKLFEPYRADPRYQEVLRKMNFL